MTPQPTFEKSIRYDRETRDYRAELDGQLVGFYPSYHAAEEALDDVAYNHLIAGDCATATELDGGATDPPGDCPLGDDEGDSVPSAVNWNSATAQAAAFPVCSACHTSDFPPSSLRARTCIACANAQHFGMAHRFVADPPPEPAPPVDDGEDDNWGGFRRPLGVTRQSIAIEATLQRNRLCPNCQGAHWGWQCPAIRQRLFSERAWKDITLGRELCRMRWRNFRAFVALLMSMPSEHLRMYAESYLAFIRDYNPHTDLTLQHILQTWMRIIADEGDRGPAAPALRLAA